MSPERTGRRNEVVEWTYRSDRNYEDPFADVDVEASFTGPDGRQFDVPAFWDGGQEWRVRFAAPTTGTYRYETVCSNEADDALHGRTGTLDVGPYEGDNELLEHGPIAISDDGHFEYRDGTPFFWLGDTWWMLLNDSVAWPDEFERLAADRVEKGFSVVQIVAGPPGDVDVLDERAKNDGEYPWSDDLERINPAFYDRADDRIRSLVDAGLVPCLLGSWGYYLPWFGADRMKRHWRHLIARYGAYPVVYALAGETDMPWYLSRNEETRAREQREGWADVGRYVRERDPYGRPVSTHPGGFSAGRDEIADVDVLDFDMIQTGQPGRDDAHEQAARQIRDAPTESPIPVVNGEGFYEGLLAGNREEVQRFMFWTTMLSGHVGYTYGADGIFQGNRPDDPFGPSPHPLVWGDTPWKEAIERPGASHVGEGRTILERYDWWRFEPYPEWVEPAADVGGPFVAGVPSDVRVVYLPPPSMVRSTTYELRGLDPDASYEASFVDPRDGTDRPLSHAPSGTETWTISEKRVMWDQIFVLETV